MSTDENTSEIQEDSPTYILPNYSLTGDLLSFLRCGLQYRYQKKGDWKSSRPLQYWYGEFIHKMMAAAYLNIYNKNRGRSVSDYDWKTDLRPLEMRINNSLLANGIPPPAANLFCMYDEDQVNQRGCEDNNHPHKSLASQRAEMAIKQIGSLVFDFLDEVEISLKGTRDIIDYNPDEDRCDKYGITGIVDVISSIDLRNAPFGTGLITLLNEAGIKRSEILSDEFEIIIDYKGARRPALDSTEWNYHEWQIAEYAWLRSRNSELGPPRVGIIFYINELAPSRKDLLNLKEEISNSQTDIKPEGPDLNEITSFTRRSSTKPELSTYFRGQRTIRIIRLDNQDVIDQSLIQFDNTVRNIETNILQEKRGQEIQNTWEATPSEKNCSICDFRYFCREARNSLTSVSLDPQVPPRQD